MLLAAALVFVASSPAWAGVSDLTTLVRRADGSFDATCVDGQRQTVSATDLLADRVCDGGSSNLVCAADVGSSVRLTTAEGRQLGSPQGSSACARTVEAAREGVVCAFEGSNRYVPRNIRTGEALGRGQSLSTCLDQIQTARNGLVCGFDQGNWYRPFRIHDGATMGNTVSLSTCRALVEQSTSSLVCTFDWGNWYDLRNIRDGATIGEHTSLKTCLAKLR